MAASATKNYILGGLVLLGAWGFSKLGSDNQPLPPTPQRQEAISFDPSTYIDPYGTTTCYPSSKPRHPRQYSSNTNAARGKYHYVVTISDARREWETYESEPLINGDIRLKRKSPSLDYLNGTYEWDMDEYLPDQDAMFNYIYQNYSRMKQYKVHSSKRVNDADEFNNRLDEYLEDPEDESQFPPEIFDFLED